MRRNIISTNKSPDWQLAWNSALKPAKTGRRQFWFDEHLPEDACNISRKYPPVQKLGVIMKADAPDEHLISSFCGSTMRLEDGRYRQYYTTLTASGWWITVGESSDGLHWEKRPLGQYFHEGKDTNRIVLEDFDENQASITCPQVLRIPDGTWRMYFWHHTKRFRFTVAHSDDGLRWRVDKPLRWFFIDTEIEGRSRLENGWAPNPTLSSEDVSELWRLKSLRSNDAAYVYYNEFLERFEFYAQWLVPQISDRHVAKDNIANGCRCIQRRVSSDGYDWSDPELILVPDRRDPWDLQFYSLSVQWHENWMIGSLGHYRVEAEQQTCDLELAFSRDGRNWQRPLRGGFIPRGQEGERDSKWIGASNAWIDEGETWLCLYTGIALKHCEMGKASADTGHVTMGARWPKHRFLGLAAGSTPGGFLSDVFISHSAEIAIDADIRGWLRAELCDVFGRKIPGYHLTQSVPLSGNGHNQVLRWSGRATDRFRFDAIRVRFEFQDGEIYSLGF